MKKISMVALIILMSFIIIFSRCNQGQTNKTEVAEDSMQTQSALASYGGYESQAEWGKHLVTIGGCNDCHTPKKMGPHGPEDNMDLLLSGHPSQAPIPDIDRKEIESKGLAVFGGTFTSYVGPWGVSFSANLTSDSTTGLGNWTLEQFIRTFKTGKYGGAPGGRNLLPPMPFQNVAQMTDDELKAVFAYLQSTNPIHNIVPQPLPPVLAMKK
ncbi:MAG: diheme cytochrome c-553 [Ginsengibacter sp.]